jgi:transcriptional regulator with XRE-family HTH domain/tetratricopeptide (TPR) repeat protein
MATPNKKLEAARMQKRWSIAVASAKSGVSVNTFNRWERGLQVPQLATLDQVCKAFGMSPDELGFADVISAKRRTKPDPAGRAAPRPQEASPPSPPLVPTTISTTSSLAPTTQISLDPVTPAIILPQPQLTPALDACIQQARKSLESMNQVHNTDDRGEGVSRRQAITTLISTPAAVLGLTHAADKTILQPEEALALCAVNIPLCWQLYFEGGLVEVGKTLPGYLTQLTALVQHPSHYQRRAASLASKGHQLASLLALQYQNFGIAFANAKQALEYGKLAEDTNLQTASWIRLAQVYLYLKRPHARLNAYEHAVQLSSKASPLIRGRVYIGLIETCSALGHEREAQHFLDLAYRTFPERYEEDPHFVYTHFNNWSLSEFQGLMYLNLNQPQKAWEGYVRMDQILSTDLIPNRVELMVRLADTSFALGDLEQSCVHVARAANAASTAGNQLRFDETYHTYQLMQAKWGNEPRVQELRDLFL